MPTATTIARGQVAGPNTYYGHLKRDALSVYTSHFRSRVQQEFGKVKNRFSSPFASRFWVALVLIFSAGALVSF
jgi:hypothetical protein